MALNDEIRVYDDRNAQQLQASPDPFKIRINTFNQLQQLFKVQVWRDQGWEATPPGETCFKIVSFRVRFSDAEYPVKVYDWVGQPYPEVVVFSWNPAASTFDRNNIPIKPYYGGDRRQIGDGVFVYDGAKYEAGKTNAEGVHGVPFGPGSVMNPAGGIDRIWISASPPGQGAQYSDCAAGLSWVGGTKYLVCYPEFQEIQKPFGPDPDPDPDPEPDPGPDPTPTPAGDIVLTVGDAVVYRGALVTEVKVVRKT
jgi:hypothetical protein